MRPAGPPEHADPAVALACHEALAGLKLKYRRQPYQPARSEQPVRHMDWMATEGGTCVDLAVAYAAMCLECGVAPLIALTADHAFVVLRLGHFDGAGRWTEEPLHVDGGRVLEAGVVEVDGALLSTASQRGGMLGVDAVKAARPGESPFAQAVASSASRATGPIQLIDVAFLHQHGGWPPLLPPSHWPAIRRSVPEEAEPVTLNDAQQTCAQKASEVGGGVIALIAPAGQGKSTVARHIARTAPNAAGWFLGAADAQALSDSLAEVEVSQQGVALPAERLDREAFAAAALGRLRKVETPWVVVLDNADGDPAAVQGKLPHPGHGQLVLITTTNEAWAAVAGVRPLHLAPVAEPEAQRQLGSQRLAELADGRALVLRAMSRLLQDGVEVAGLEAHAPTPEEDVDGALAGPLTVWRAVRAMPEADERHLRAAAAAALLPPDHLPAEVLCEVADIEADELEWLAGKGILDAVDRTRPTRLHRLFGASIRLDLAEAPLLAEVARRIASSQPCRLLLERQGDLATVRQLLRQVSAPAPQDLSGQADALGGLAHALEIRGDTVASQEAFEGALALAGSSSAARRLEASSKLSRARTVNRNHAREPDRLEAALALAREGAHLIVEVDGDGSQGRFVAMEGLILKQLATLEPDEEAKRGGLLAAREVLRRADDLRAHLPEDDTERVRSLFNLAGIEVPLAQVDHEAAEDHLDEAARIYSLVAERRTRMFGSSVHPQIAPCVVGLGMVGYYRALLEPEPDARSAHLREATRSVVAALDQWQTIEGPADRVEVSKAARLLAKVALARHLAPMMQGRQEVDEAFLIQRVDPVAREAVRELRR